ncbi:hypothetical protein R6Q59_030698 [Mikania micrantha]
MEMEFMAEFPEGMSRDRARQIIKRKRTKRQRPCSPTDGDCLIDNFTPSEVSEEMSTEEDEDMANCLILLAQSVSPVAEEEKSKTDQIRRKTEKLSSRRFTGDYAYECKTCNRSFPSFQALGGHRASHKKPKVNLEEKKSNLFDVPLPVMQNVEEHHEEQKVIEEDEENKTSIINNIQTGIINNNTKGKVHECSICGSEFLSGQALGGHMRKHRPIPATINRTVISMNTDDSSASGDTDRILEKSPAGSCSMLSLDLNFPPPEVVEDNHRSKFQFTGDDLQQRLVFSAPAFVDCHY